MAGSMALIYHLPDRLEKNNQALEKLLAAGVFGGFIASVGSCVRLACEADKYDSLTYMKWRLMKVSILDRFKAKPQYLLPKVVNS